MNDEISKLAIAAISATIGFVASLLTTYFTNRSATKREAEHFRRSQSTRKTDLFRERGEELYAKVDQLLAFVYGRALRHREVTLSRKTAEVAFDEDLVASRELSDAQSRVPLLIEVYFPTVIPSHKMLLTAIEAFDDKVREIDSASVDGKIQPEDRAKLVDVAGMLVQDRGRELKNKIAEAIQTV